MKFSGPRFVVALVATAIAALVVLAALRAFGILVSGPSPDDPAELVKTANQNLEAVRRRQPGDRRPASYDSVLAPLDALLRQTRELMQSPEFNPGNDAEKVRALAAPVIDIATRADQLARSETGYLTKTYRFNDQKAEASQYLAAALWERLQARQAAQPGFLSETPRYPPGELAEIKRILGDGLAADPESRDLHYMRAVVSRAEGLFAAAARDLEKAVEADPNFAEGWNTLALVRISLKEFGKAEEAYERAKALALEAARASNSKPGPEYVTILYNLAVFHDSLASFYERENRINPTVESERLAARHGGEAKRYFEEFLSMEPAGSSDAQLARTRLSALR